MKKAIYQVEMVNEDNGYRKQIEFEGSLIECKKYMKDKLAEIREEIRGDSNISMPIEIWDFSSTNITGSGHRGEFSYKIVRKNK